MDRALKKCQNDATCNMKVMLDKNSTFLAGQSFGGSMLGEKEMGRTMQLLENTTSLRSNDSIGEEMTLRLRDYLPYDSRCTSWKIYLC